MEERKCEKTTLLEMLEFINKDIPYEQDKERDRQQDYRDEVEKRYPFARIIRKINQMEKTIQEQKKVIELLVKHTHNKNDGKVQVAISETEEAWRFK